MAAPPCDEASPGAVVRACDETSPGAVVRACDEASPGAVVSACDETSGRAGGRARIDTGRWAGLAEAVLRDEGVSGGELGLRFVDAAAMAELNLAHMGAPGPTDVLAFPIDAPIAAGNGAAPGPGPAVLLGDVVVCPEYAEPRSSGDPADGLALLVVHGVLHVLGYDHAHDEEAAAMQAREQELLAAHHRPRAATGSSRRARRP